MTLKPSLKRTRYTNLHWLKLALLFICLQFFSNLSAAPNSNSKENNQEKSNAHWTGAWNTVWRDGGARMILQQNGNQVTGTYNPYLGKIEATVKGNILSGRWIEERRSGNFIFTLAPDKKTFIGRYDTGEWWNGEKVADQAETIFNQANLNHPVETLKSFLIAYNQLNNGQYQYSDIALDSLDFANFGQITAVEKSKAATKLYQLLDQCTFRIWDVRPEDDSDSFSYPLAQLGSELTTEITFKRNAAGEWRLLVPSDEKMEQQLKAFLAARGLEKQDPNGHFKLSNPRDTLRTFIEQIAKWNQGGREYVLKTMDLSRINETIRPQEAAIRAEYLKHILDRISYNIWQEIPNDPNSTLPYLHFQHPLGDIVIAPVKVGEKTLWQFDWHTLENVKSLYKAFEGMPLVEGLSAESQQQWFFKIRQFMRHQPWLITPLFGTELWQWLSLLVIILASFILSKYLAQILIGGFRAIRRLLGFKSGSGKVTKFYGPIRISLIALFWKLSLSHLGLPDELYLVLNWLASVVVVLAVAWMAFRLTDWIGEHIRSRATNSPGQLDDILVSLVIGLIKVIIVASSSLALANVMGIPYQSVLAGLGIGGLAVAFAARETIADFFGSAVLLADRPFRQGDRVNIGEIQGYIEYVGLRSTQIRTLDDSIVTIPNSRLAHEMIDNRKQRNARHFKTKISVTHETSAEKLEEFAEQIKQTVLKQPEGLPDKLHCGVWEFGASSIELQLFCYLKVNTRQEEYTARNRLMTGIIRLARDMQVDFAYPTRTLYLQSDKQTEK